MIVATYSYFYGDGLYTDLMLFAIFLSFWDYFKPIQMDEVREVVDIDLGITDRSQTPVPGKELQAFLYISNANKVIAAAFVEHIEKVSRTIAGSFSKILRFLFMYMVLKCHLQA